MMEMLESRRLLNAGSFDAPLRPDSPAAAAALAVGDDRPSVFGTTPANEEADVRRDIFIGVDVNLPNGALDAATVTTTTVKLYKTAIGATIPASVNTSGGGDSIVLQPAARLAKDTNYTFEITSGVKDVTGASFVPFKMTFTSGEVGGEQGDSFAFSKVILPATIGHAYTALQIGPDRKLYAGTNDGLILRYPINADGTLGAVEQIDSLQESEDGPTLLTGFAFDPASTADNLVLWAVHSDYAFDTSAKAWSGKITRMRGPNLGDVDDMVTGLPRASYDHTTNQPVFGPDGALYFGQGGNTAQGARDNTWGLRDEELLGAAILRLDTSKLPSNGSLNVRTSGGPNYNPWQANAPLTIYATGVRNAYDLVWTSDGKLFAPNNGSNPQGATPGTDGFNASGVIRIDGDDDDNPRNGHYSGPDVPALNPVLIGQNDYLYQIEQGGYYGHPNPKRAEFVLNGGNPTSGTDPQEVSQYPVGTDPDRNYRGAAFDFGPKVSPNGIIEYTSDAFDGELQGKLIAARYSGGDDLIILTRGSDDSISSSLTGVMGLSGYDQPLDLIEDPVTGNIYVAEYEGQRITLSRPTIPPSGGPPPVDPDGPFTSTDINANREGSNSRPSGIDDAYDVTAAGRNIFGTDDGFRFLHLEQEGDFDMRVRVDALGAAGPISKAGIMAREGLDPDARNVFASVTAQSNHRLSYRSRPGDITHFKMGQSPPGFPDAWVRLKREGSVFIAFSGADGQNWTETGRVRMAMGETVELGLAVSSAHGDQTTTARFRDYGDAAVMPTPPTQPPPQPPSQNGVWTSGPSIPEPMSEVGGALIGNKVYVAGEGTTRTYIFDPAAGTWTDAQADRPFPGDPTNAEHSAQTVGGKLYLIGGLSGGSENKVQIYDPVANAWTLGADQPFNSGSASSAVIGGEIYLAGGAVRLPEYAPVANTAKYNPATNVWTPLASMPLPRHAAASATDGQKLYIFGGRDAGLEQSSGTSTVQVYDPATNTWTTSDQAGGPAAMPRKSRGNTAVRFRDEIYIIGGETSFATDPDATDKLVFKRVDIYNPITNTWRRGPDMPTARHAHLALALDNKIYVIGGGTERGTSVSSIVELLTIP